MKQRILTAAAALLCALTLFSTAIAPAMAYAPPSGGGDASIQAEEVCIYYKTDPDTGIRYMRLWSITRGVWISDWVPVPEGWNP